MSGGLQLSGFRPNPARRGTVSGSLALPSPAPAVLELFDLAGRRVGSVEVTRFGPGRHVVSLDASRADPGVYWLRLSQSGAARSVRGVIVR